MKYAHHMWLYDNSKFLPKWNSKCKLEMWIMKWTHPTPQALGWNGLPPPQACCDTAFEYAHQRRQFGSRIGQFKIIIWAYWNAHQRRQFGSRIGQFKIIVIIRNFQWLNKFFWPFFFMPYHLPSTFRWMKCNLIMVIPYHWLCMYHLYIIGWHYHII